MTGGRAAAALALLAAGAAVAAPTAGPLPLPPGAERAYQVMSERVSAAAALDVVAAMDGKWRLAGNPDYNSSIDDLRDRLAAAGFSPSPGAEAAVHVEEFDSGRPGWSYRVGTVAFDGSAEPPLLSREHDFVSLAINSFPTPPGGLQAPLIDVGAGGAADYAGRTVTGAVVLTDAPLGRVWRDAVKRRGAAGVISTQAAAIVRPPGELTEAQQDVLQWDSLPYDKEARSFGFKASYRAAARMRQRLRAGPVTVRVSIDASFHDGPGRTLVAEIRGRSRPDEHHRRRRARAGARRQRQCERLRHAAGDGQRSSAGHRGRGAPGAGPDADVSVGG